MISSFIKDSTQSSIIQIWVKIKGVHQNKSCTCRRIQLLVKWETDRSNLIQRCRENCARNSGQLGHHHSMQHYLKYSKCILLFLCQAALNRTMDHDPWFTICHRWVPFYSQENIHMQLSYRLINASWAEKAERKLTISYRKLTISDVSQDMPLGWNSPARLSYRLSLQEKLTLLNCTGFVLVFHSWLMEVK